MGKPLFVTFDDWQVNLRVYANRMGYTTVRIVDDDRVAAEEYEAGRGSIDVIATTAQLEDLMLVPINVVTSKPVAITTINDVLSTLDQDAMFRDFLEFGAISMRDAGMPGAWFEYGFGDGQKEPADFYYIHTVFDVIATIMLRVKPDDAEFMFPMIKTHPMATSMVFVTKDFGYHVHSIYSTYSFNVKWLSIHISQVLQWHGDDPHAVRRQILADFGGQVVHHRAAVDLDGVLNIDGRNVLINVSGHMINYLVLSYVYPFCVKRYLAAIEWNYDVASGKRLTNDEKRLIKQFQLAEVGNSQYARSVWHNPIDYALSVHCVSAFLRLMGIKLGNFSHTLNRVMARIRGWVQKYPKFRFKPSLSLTRYDAEGKDVVAEAVRMKLAVSCKLDKLLENPATDASAW